jgi:hypothetical protein
VTRDEAIAYLGRDRLAAHQIITWVASAVGVRTRETVELQGEGRRWRGSSGWDCVLLGFLR